MAALLLSRSRSIAHTLQLRRVCLGNSSTTPHFSAIARSFCSAPVSNLVPATVITGSSGSGKTTLLNHILTSQHGKRIAVIENGFGDMGSDGSLVASHSSSNEKITMVNNGCLRCTVCGDLTEVLYKLVKNKRDIFDHIVIGTTDNARPVDICEMFCTELRHCVKLEGIVTLVDCTSVWKHLENVDETTEQISFADRIIFNKTELVIDPTLKYVTKTIKEHNGLAPIMTAKHGVVDMDFVLGTKGHHGNRLYFQAEVKSKSRA